VKWDKPTLNFSFFVQDSQSMHARAGHIRQIESFLDVAEVFSFDSSARVLIQIYTSKKRGCCAGDVWNVANLARAYLLLHLRAHKRIHEIENSVKTKT
jgi:hypothetical protein